MKHITTHPLLAAGIAALLSPAIGSAHTLYAVTTTNALATMDSAAPGAASTVGQISGLAAGEVVLGIDFRPLDGQLYALGSNNRIYTINTSTAAATLVGSGFGPPSLNGLSYGWDFNPTVDRIRAVSDTAQNLRLNPITGGVAATDTNLAYALADVNAGDNPAIVGSAYTNNFAGATSTTLYGIDWAQDLLVTQTPANDGTLQTVGLGLGFNTSDQVGFDIVTGQGLETAYASLTTGDGSGLYFVNLTTGAASSIGLIGVGSTIRDIAVAPVPVPAGAWLMAPAVMAVWRFRSRKTPAAA